MNVTYNQQHTNVQHSMVVLYTRDHEDLGFSSQKYHPKKLSLQYLSGALAVVVR